MNFDHALNLLDSFAFLCSDVILLVLAIAARWRTQDWGFSCWIFSSSCALCQSASQHSGRVLTYLGSETLFFLTVLVFTVGAIRIVCRFLHLFRLHHPSGISHPSHPADA